MSEEKKDSSYFESLVNKTEDHAETILGMHMTPVVREQVRKIVTEELETESGLIVSTDQDGTPVINFTRNPQLNSALTDTAKSLYVKDKSPELKEALQILEDVESQNAFYEELQFSVGTSGVSDSGMPVRSVASKKSHVEVVPGVMVAQHLIDAAVESTVAFDARTEEVIQEAERQQVRKQKDLAELRTDIDNSSKFVKEMFDRMRNPAKYDEKFISYDQMPKPLQRVVNAYMAVNEANRELEEAIKGISALKSEKAA